MACVDGTEVVVELVLCSSDPSLSGFDTWSFLLFEPEGLEGFESENKANCEPVKTLVKVPYRSVAFWPFVLVFERDQACLESFTLGLAGEAETQ